MREIHPLAAIFPPLDDRALEALAADIRSRGLIEPILVDGEGRVLDGRARLAACEATGREPRFAPCHEDALAAILIRNGQRRQLSPGQRALAAARALPHLQSEARKNRRILKRQGYLEKESNLTPGRGLRKQVAARFGISAGSVAYGQQVLKRGLPGLIKAVEESRIKVSRAAWLARQPAEVVAAALWDRGRGLLRGVRPLPAFPAPEPGRIQVPRRHLGDPAARMMDAITILDALSRMMEAYEMARDIPPGRAWEAQLAGRRGLAFLDCFMRHWHARVQRAGGIGEPGLEGR